MNSQPASKNIPLELAELIADLGDGDMIKRVAFITLCEMLFFGEGIAILDSRF